MKNNCYGEYCNLPNAVANTPKAQMQRNRIEIIA